MSTKKLERTVIEGGRTRWNKYERRHSHRSERARARAQKRRWVGGVQDLDDGGIRRREPVYKDFADKLGPAERWLLAQRGRPWRSVHSELMQTFETRSIAGRHIVFDHMLPGWSESFREGWRVSGRWRFRVDAHGFLRAEQLRWGHRGPRYPKIRAAIQAWLGRRRIALRGEVAYWLEPVYPPETTGEPAHQRWRQAHPLDDAERRRLETLNDDEREHFVRAYE